MKRNESRIFREVFAFASALAFMSILSACSDDKVAGGSSDDAGLAIKNLDVAGVSQKGPFVKGSAVTVQGIDCKTMKFKEEIFEGSVKNDMGEFVVENVNLSTTCAVVEVTGEYRSEMTGKKVSDKLTLRALTNLKDRTHVNVNLLTNLEYERVMYYVTKKGKTFDEAKELAESEVLAAFGMAGESTDFEDLDIFGTSDADATLLAISVLMQGDADVKTLTERLDKFNDSFAKSGKWNDDDTKKAIIDWIANAVAKAVMDSIRKNMENWGFANEVPDFEKAIEMFGADSTMTDSRDGQTYKTVKIGEQVWMAENLNFKVDGSYCYNDSAEYCAKYGRLYEWSAAMDACPSGWHLPDTAEWRMLLAAVGGDSIAGMKLKSTSGWNSDGNGTDDFGFTVLPAGGWGSKNFVGEAAVFWTSEWYEGYDDYAYGIKLYTDTIVRKGYSHKYIGSSVRCLKGESPVAGSSSSLAKSSSSYSDGWSWDVPKEARLNPNIKYDSMIDPRDKKVYKVVKIDVEDENYSQVWMAENLNYADSNRTPSLKGGNWCYQGDEKKCKVSGRYYSWAAAIDSVALANDAEAPLDCGYGKKCGLDRAVQGICPDGWHLPSIYEWGLLSVALGNAPVSGEPLKALTGWNYAGTPDNNGTDLYGFAALPTGRRISATKWEKVGSDVYYWSATEYSANDGRYFNINNVYTNSYTYQDYKSYGQSVRCVKGDPSTAPVRPSSSSSVTSVSSSSVESSSSSDGFDWSLPKEAYLNPDIEYDSIVDSRDGKVYKTVKIGDQTWMAENLNFDPGQGGSGDAKYDWSWCRNCEVIGHLYTWAAAIDSVKLANDAENPQDCGYGKGCGLTGKLQGICPDGWHLPSKAEWQDLFDAVGGRSTAGEVLKSQTGWYRKGNGTDAFGFSALPAGDKSDNGYFYHAGDIAYFWSATGNSDHFAYLMYLGYGYKYADLYDDNKNYGYSVRCVKD